MIKKILAAIILLVLIGVGAGVYLWNKPHKKAEDEKGIAITAEALAKEYNDNEKAADAKYLNKVIEVSGKVNEVIHDQDGGIMLILATGDPIAVVQCAMRDKGVKAAEGNTVVLKGFCSGNGIAGVSLTGCVIK